MRTASRTNDIPGIQMRCSPRLDPTARTSESKSARAPAATNSSARNSFLLMFGHLRNPEIAFQRRELLEIDRADEIDDGQLPRLRGDDYQTGDRVALRQRVDRG